MQELSFLALMEHGKYQSSRRKIRVYQINGAQSTAIYYDGALAGKVCILTITSIVFQTEKWWNGNEGNPGFVFLDDAGRNGIASL